MITTICLLALVTADVIYEVVAHFVFHNTTVQTASWVVRHFEGKSLVRKFAVSSVIVVLWLHLVAELF